MDADHRYFEDDLEEDEPSDSAKDALGHMVPVDGAARSRGGDPHRPFQSIKTLTSGFDPLSSEQEMLLRDMISEIVRKCGKNSWCLYTKKKNKKTGKRRRLGTHSSKAAAYRQEYAIKAHGG
jgi:hypothetical protein